MKVSKLFHWLYAILMLLPMFFFLCFALNGVFKTNLGYESFISSLDSSFTYIWSLPLFSWASSSFLIAPFNYIMTLFGVSSTSLISVCLDYWLCISIIWLVFDLVMYLPLLVHSWIDRGIIQ